MNLPKLFVDRPVTTIMVFLGILAIGIVSVSKLPIDLFPEIENPVISVLTQYPGASAKDVETNVTKKIESWLSTVNELDKITSTSIDNMSIVQCQFKWGANLDEAANDIRNLLEMSKREMPADAEPPFIFKFGSNMFPILVYGITAEESYEGLNKLIEKKIADPLKRLPGVGAVLPMGAPIRQILVKIDPAKLEAYNLSIERLAGSLAAENLTLPVGNLRMGRLDYNLRVPGEFHDPAQIGKVIVAQYRGRPVYLADVATVVDTLKERSINIRLLGGKGTSLIVQKQSGANTVNVARSVKKRLTQLEQRLPADVKIHLVLDSSKFIVNSIKNLSEAVILGGIFVVLVILIFLRQWRATLIIAFTIPFSLVVALIYLYITGDTINIITLSSLSIAVGMVVDDAIVILENITRHIEQGARPREAAIFGSNEVGLAVAASTFAIVAVFFPLSFLTGIAGVFFHILGILVTVTIITSLFASLSLVPMLSARLYKRRSHLNMNNTAKSRFYTASERLFVRLEEAYQHLLRWSLQHRKTVIVVALLLFISSMLLFKFIGTEFLPQSDDGTMQINVELQPGTRLERTVDYVKQIEKLIKDKVPELRYYSVQAGVNDEGFSSILFGQKEGPNIFLVRALLSDHKYRTRSVFEIADTLRRYIKKIPGITSFSISAAGAGSFVTGATGKQLAVDIIGYDLETTSALAGQIADKLKTIPGAVDVALDRGKDRPEIEIVPDRDKLAAVGLNTAMVASAVRNHMYGKVATKFRQEGNEFDVFIRLDASFRRSLQNVENISIQTITGRLVKLKDIAVIREVMYPPEIKRKNQERVVTVGANVSGRALGDVTADLKAYINSLEIPPGVDIEYSGQVEQQSDAFADLSLFLILSIFLVYMIMASQFESLLHPFVIMFSVPFALVGVAWGLYLTGMPLSSIAFLATIMLIGIVVKNAIVLVDYTNILRARGYELFEAIVVSGGNRLRPVLMTAITTILGMLPLAISSGEGAETWQPLGVTVIFGLLVSTVVTLVLIPVIYSLFETRLKREK
ncbi:MAG TPA: efflux RND transporter permease subunit [Caldithrix abyssi]|uniref:Efflux RND transporter permease subunit n=1 Tax=Caldithrix abyssi TaxID=187145 RepID=A0A7V4U0B9_CALAY|nr:efflux RND transporter permease subunit [Caldithrix abyssi]